MNRKTFDKSAELAVMGYMKKSTPVPKIRYRIFVRQSCQAARGVYAASTHNPAAAFEPQELGQAGIFYVSQTRLSLKMLVICPSIWD